MNRMMKKAAAAVMSLAMIASAGAAVSADVLKEMPAISASAYQSGHLTYTLNSNGTAYITGIVDDELWWIQNIEVPEKINGHTVTGISGLAFQGAPYLKKVTIKARITLIEAFTFASLPNLEEVVLPPSLQKIQMSAFQNCTKLKTITFPYRVNYIGSQAFKNCRSLKKIVFMRKNCSTIDTTAFDLNGNANGAGKAKVYLPDTSYSNLNEYFTGDDGQGHYNYVINEYKLGDANTDGFINQNDATKVLQAYTRLCAGNSSGLNALQTVNADVDGDGQITAMDAQLIQTYLTDQYAQMLGVAGFVCAYLNHVSPWD